VFQMQCRAKFLGLEKLHSQLSECAQPMLPAMAAQVSRRTKPRTGVKVFVGSVIGAQMQDISIPVVTVKKTPCKLHTA
jgi:hypothetical protein